MPPPDPPRFRSRLTLNKTWGSWGPASPHALYQSGFGAEGWSAASLCRHLGSLHSTYPLETWTPAPTPLGWRWRPEATRRMLGQQRYNSAPPPKMRLETRLPAPGGGRPPLPPPPPAQAREGGRAVKRDWSRPTTPLSAPGKGRLSHRWRPEAPLRAPRTQKGARPAPRNSGVLRLGPQ